jgi:RHS repeat-associated protein
MMQRGVLAAALAVAIVIGGVQQPSAWAAPAGTMLLPTAKDHTAKWLTLKARADAAGLTGVRFQYRDPKQRAWVDIPLSSLRDERGRALASVTQPVAGGMSPTLIWDVAQVLPFGASTFAFGGASALDIPPPDPPRPGPIQVRAAFSGGPAGASNTVTAVLDEGGLSSDDARAPIGPGEVDLLTGNFSYSVTDVAIDSFAERLEMSRTYNSRNRSPSGYGAGWTWSMVVPEAGSYWSRLSERVERYEDEDGNTVEVSWVEVAAADGSVAYFELVGGGYVAAPGLEDLALSKPAADRFELRDIDGNLTEFSRSPDSSAFVPTLIRQAASETRTTFAYQPGTGRVSRVLAPVPAGVPSCEPLRAGCRTLDFVYSTQTTATGTAEPGWGHYAGQLERINFTAFEPSTGQMKTDAVAQYLYDSAGRMRAVWDPRISPALKETYDYDAEGRLTRIAPPGETAYALAYQKTGTDPDGGRLRSVTRLTPQGLATETVVYNVPVAGPGSPYKMDAAEVERWGQGADPANFIQDATAIFPPDQEPASPPASYSRAVVHYLNRDGRQVNVVAPGGHTTTSEYDFKGNVVRELSAANRSRALAVGAGSAAEARQLDMRRTYSADGLELLEELGPRHRSRLASGELVQARQRTTHVYDEGAPAGLSPKPHLPTTTTVAAQVAGRPDQDARVTKTEYDWNLRKPTATIVDPGGLNLRTVTLYDAQTGLVTETRMPRNPVGGDASTAKTVYYSAGTGWCRSDAFAGLPCQTGPAAQPSGNLPKLPTTHYSYNRLNQVTVESDSVPTLNTVTESLTLSRTTTTGYDAAGRPTSVEIVARETGRACEETAAATKQSITANAPPTNEPCPPVDRSWGLPVPKQTMGYDSQTGRPTTVSTTEEGVTRTVRTGYDSVGRVTSYTDADSNTSTTSYDLLSRPVTTNDGKGSQTRTYHPESGLLTQLDDSHAGRFTASYDPDGQLTSKTYPNGLRADTVYDAAGAPTDLTYTKTGCSANCTWFEDHVEESVHGQWLERRGSLSSQSYGYDRAGRLTTVRDSVVATACTTTRTYGFDANSNRTAFTARTAGEGSCDVAAAGLVARDERATNHGSYQGGVTLGKPGAVGDTDTAAGFDGTNDEVTTPRPSLNSAGATLEGSFYWESGNALLRDHTQVANSGWILAFDNGGTLAYRVGGKTYNTSRTTASVRNGWHHYALTVSQGNTTLYLDGTAIHSGTGAGAQQTQMPWHIMHNGSGPVFAKGKADDVAVYSRGLTAAEVRDHYDASKTTPSTYRAKVMATAGLASYWRLGEGTTQTRTSSYDAADRITGPGFSYDALGRMTAIPGSHAGGGALTSSYYINDMIRSQSQDGVSKSWELDPTLQRHRATTPNAGNQEILHYAGPFDSPAWSEQVANGTTSGWSRNVVGIDGDLAAIHDSQSGTTFQFTNLHGDLVATASPDPGATGPLQTFEADEFGNPRQPSGRRYEWLGAKRRRTEFPSGVVQMGVRSYVPALGRFTSVDPVTGGSANAYDYALADPVNVYDLDGRQAGCVIQSLVIRRRVIRGRPQWAPRAARKQERGRIVILTARVKCTDVSSWKATIQIRRHREHWIDPVIKWRQQKGMGSARIRLGADCEKGKRYHGNFTLNIHGPDGPRSTDKGISLYKRSNDVYC